MDDQLRTLFHELANMPPGERERIFVERQMGADLRAELESLLSFDSMNSHNLTACVSGTAQEVLDSLARSGVHACGPYRLVRLLGRGGMGAVYLGERADGEIQQSVAIKLLSTEGDHPEWRDRFLKERQLLASLHHPSIVHVIDAGRTADGRPYLVMEYVEGAPIDVYTARMDIRERLILFLKVCEGVSHAHRRLIIHRDLKPSNILVDASGLPKLLDFGIAKLLDEPGSVTETAERLLTPSYASPEQFRGASQATATDVYSLGAVLYKILTGRSPHDTSRALGLIADTRDVPAASRLNPKLPADIDYILRKALRVEPEERYASVDALANDIRALLEFRPIEARLGDTWYRTRKFVRRFWIPTAAALLVIASLSTGLYIANRERLLAEQRFAQLRQLSNKVFDLDKAIRELPGSTQARQQLVSASLQYLEGLSVAARGDLELAREIAQGYWRVATIQGVTVEMNLGERGEAEASLRKAANFTERVLAARPLDRDALYLAGVIANDRMILAEQEHRWVDAQAHARESAGRLDALLRLPNAGESARAAASSCYGNISLALINMRRYDEAIPYARRQVELVASAPSARILIDQDLVSLATALRRVDLEAALHIFEAQRKTAETTVYPSETLRRNDLQDALYQSGLVLAGDGVPNLDRPADAVSVLQRAFDLAEAAARDDRNDAASRDHVANAGIALANILRHRDPRRALAVYDAVLQRLSEIPTSLHEQRDRASALANSSYPLRSLARVSEAGKRIDAALTLLKEAKDYPAEQYYPDRVIYVVLCAVADHLDAVGDPRRAIETYEQLLDKVKAATPSALPDLEDAPKLSRAYEALTRLYRLTGDTAKAGAMEARRIALWQHFDRKFPNNAFIARQIIAANR